MSEKLKVGILGGTGMVGQRLENGYSNAGGSEKHRCHECQ